MIRTEMCGISADEITQFVRHVAYRLARRMPSHVRLDDLVSAGYKGVVEAGSRFDRAQGEDFRAFAEYRVKGAILDYLRSTDALRRDQRKAVKGYDAAVRRLEQQFGRAPNPEEVALELGLTAARSEAVAAMANDSVPPASLDEMLEGKHAEGIADPAAADPCEEATRSELRERVAAAVETLPERTRDVVLAYFCGELKLREIAATLCVTESRVCQILGEARVLLRPVLADLVESPLAEPVH